MEKKRERFRRFFADKPTGAVKHYSKKYAATALSICSFVLCALSVLGFTRADVLVALRGVDTSKMNAEEIIKLAMKKLVKI